MTNREFYGDFLLDCYIHHTGAGCIKGVPKPCDDVNCMECDWQDKMGYCNEEAIDEWLAKEYIEPENKVFEPQLNDTYFWIDGLYEVKYALWTNDNFDNIHKESGNACTDKEFVQEKAKQIQLYNLLSNFAYKVNEGWEPDWDVPIYLKVALNLQIANTIIDFLNLHNLNVNKLGVTNIERIENDL